jgi:hypothetical protein
VPTQCFFSGAVYADTPELLEHMARKFGFAWGDIRLSLFSTAQPLYTSVG